MNVLAQIIILNVCNHDNSPYSCNSKCWDQNRIKTYLFGFSIVQHLNAHKKQKFDSFHFPLLELRPSRGRGAKQVNLVLKAYYSHIPVSQEYFWMVDQGSRHKFTLVLRYGLSGNRRSCGILEG